MGKVGRHFLLIALLAAGSWAHALDNPAQMNFDGVLLDTSNAPITTATSVKFQIYDPAAACLLYEETQTITPDSSGAFSAVIGVPGNRASVGIDGGLPWKTVFSNKGVLRATSSSNCTPGYTPATTDGRKLRVTVGGNVLSPDFSISSAPFATTADTLQGYQPSDFLSNLGGSLTGFLKMDSQNQVRFADAGNTNYVALKAPATVSASYSLMLPAADGSSGQVLSTNGAGQLSWSSAGAGTVTNVSSANTDISVSAGSSAPVLTLNAGTAGGGGDANKIPRLNGSGQLVAAMLPPLDTSNVGTGTLSIARGGTNSSTALTNNRVMISSGSAIVEAAAIAANMALVSDANGIPTAGSVTSTELNYLSGVTAAVQTQISGKQAASTELTGLSSLALNGLVQRTGTGTYTALGTTAPLAITAGNLYMFQANGSQDGYLSMSDWSTFNSKQGALGFTPINKAGDSMTGVLNLTSNGLNVGSGQLVVNSGNVGVGTTAPSDLLTVAAAGATSTGARISVLNPDSSAASDKAEVKILNYSSGVGSTASLSLYTAAGSFGTPNPVSSGDVIGSVTAAGYTGSGFLPGAKIDFRADQAWTGSTTGSSIAFSTAQNGFSTVTERMRIDNNGFVGIGTTFPNVSLDMGMKTDAMAIPRGTSAQRPSGPPGMVRYNTTVNDMEMYDGTVWRQMSPVSLTTITGGYSDSSVATSTTYYTYPNGHSQINGGTPSTTDYSARTRNLVSHSGKLKNLVVRMTQDPASTWVFSVLINGSPSGMTCSVTSGGLTCSDFSNFPPVNVGDEIGMKIDTGANGASARAIWAFDLEYP